MILLLLFFTVSSVVIAVNIFPGLFSWSDIFNRNLSFIEKINPLIVLGIFIAIKGRIDMVII